MALNCHMNKVDSEVVVIEYVVEQLWAALENAHDIIRNCPHSMSKSKTNLGRVQNN